MVTITETGDILKINTALLHNAFDGDEKTGATVVPIYQVSAFALLSSLKRYSTTRLTATLIPG